MGRLWNWLKSLVDPKPPAPPPAPIDPPPVPSPETVVVHLLMEHNNVRKDARREDLKLSLQLCLAAQNHANWMARNRDMDHTQRPGTPGFTGKSFLDRVKLEGYKMGGGGENIAAGQRTVEQAMSSWIASNGHYQNIVNKTYRDAGFGCAADANGSLYWCAVFGVTQGQQESAGVAPAFMAASEQPKPTLSLPPAVVRTDLARTGGEDFSDLNTTLIRIRLASANCE